MNKKLIDKIAPFIGLGIFLVIAVLVFIFLSYVFVVGVLVGGVLYLLLLLKKLFFKNNSSLFSTKLTRTNSQKERKKGRIIEHNKK